MIKLKNNFCFVVPDFNFENMKKKPTCVWNPGKEDSPVTRLGPELHSKK